MAYDKDKIYDKAIKTIKDKNLLFVEDVISLLPCSKPTFYEMFPPNSNELNNIKDLLDDNKVNMKLTMRKNWLKSKAPALQTALYKLICDDSERKKLSMQYQETELKGNLNTATRYSFDDIPEDILTQLADQMQEAEFNKEMELKNKSE